MVDHKDPPEDNIPSVVSPFTEGGIYDGQVWGDCGIDPRKAANHHRSGPKLLSVSPSIVTNRTLLDYFIILFSMDYVKGTMIPGTNRRLPGGDTHVSEHDLIKWLGMWLMMGCYKGNWGRWD